MGLQTCVHHDTVFARFSVAGTFALAFRLAALVAGCRNKGCTMSINKGRQNDVPLLLLLRTVFSLFAFVPDRPEPGIAGSSVISSAASSYSLNDIVCCIEEISRLGFTIADEAELDGQELDMSGDSDPNR